MKDSEKVLLIGAAGVAAFFLYRWWKDNSLGQTYGNISDIATNTGGILTDTTAAAKSLTSAAKSVTGAASNIVQGQSAIVGTLANALRGQPNLQTQQTAANYLASGLVSSPIFKYVAAPLGNQISNSMKITTSTYSAMGKAISSIIYKPKTSSSIPSASIKSTIGIAPKPSSKPIVSAASIQQQINKKLNPFKK